MKRKKGIIIAFILVVIVASMLCGCTSRVFETEYFVCWTAADNEYVTICDLTELGRQQKNLVLPKEIKGMEVAGMIDRRYWYKIIDVQSEVLEKIYVNESMHFKAHFSNCPNFKKFLYQGSFRWVLPNGGIAYYKAPVYFKNRVSSSDQLPANVSFVLNFLTDDLVDYYWVDDIEDGEKIEVIPEEPKREGYAFGGWYKETECINAWDFENDAVTKVKFFDDTPQEQFVETKLYAKWIKK